MPPRRRRVLVLASYPERAACTRFRASMFFPWLAERGIDAELHPFLDDAFFAEFYQPDRRAMKALKLARASLERVALLLRAREFDAMFVQREAALIGPALFERVASSWMRVPMLFDLDDALWLAGSESGRKGSRHPIASRLLKSPGKTDWLIRASDRVLAGSKHLAEYARALNPNTEIVPTVVSRERWRPLPERLAGAMPHRVPVIGWIGTHSTALQLDMVLPALRRLAGEGERFQFRMVGASRPDIRIDGVDVEDRAWSLDREVENFQDLDVGLAPLFNDAWSEGKCGFKQLQYMATGVPIVSSLSGSARDFLRHGENALIARDEGEWYEHLRLILHDADLRARLVRGARDVIEREYCAEVQGPRVAAAVESVFRR